LGMKNPVKSRLKNGQVSLGTWIGIGHPDVTERLAEAGFDWLTFDIEHSPLSLETVQSMIQAMSFTLSCPGRGDSGGQGLHVSAGWYQGRRAKEGYAPGS